MPEHKHASVLRAIADGVPLSEFEVCEECFKNVVWHETVSLSFVTNPDDWKVRRKPQYIIVNGFKVPKPLDVMPEDGAWTPDFERNEMVFCYHNNESLRRIVTNKCAHLTKEAAIAHAMAMLGIDPKWEE